MNIHLIAIGGAAMHNLALALAQNGHQITGSDDHIFEPSASRLKQAGLFPQEEGWFPEKITSDIDLIILGMHAHKDNPELLKAQELGLKIVSYPKFIYENSLLKTRVVIGGSHGKTSITSMILHILSYYKKDFDYLVGAKIEGFDTMVRLSDAPIIVIEGDEYLSSALEPTPKFHQYHPHIAVISGIAWDHINVFPTYENYVHQFDTFIKSVESNGTLFYCATDSDLTALAEQNKTLNAHLIAYDTHPFSIKNGTTELEVEGQNYPLTVFGHHNLQNIKAAQLVVSQLGITEAQALEALKSFKGAAKRLEQVFKNDQLTIFKDFAHSPSKLKATLKAVREQFPERQLIACMELHTYSSLSKAFLSHYKDCMATADQALVYFNPKVITQKRLESITEDDVKKGFGAQHPITISTSLETTLEFLKAQTYKNTCLLMMTSGNFDGLDLDHLDQLIRPTNF